METAAAIYHALDREETILAKVSLSEIRKRRLEEGTAGRRPEMLPGRDTATHTKLHSPTMMILPLPLFPFRNYILDLLETNPYSKRIHIRSSMSIMDRLDSNRTL